MRWREGRQRGAPRAPVWVRRPRLFQVSTPVIIAQALIVEAFLLLPEGNVAAAMTGIVMTAAGTVLGYRRPAWGLALVALAPVTTALLGAEPIILWTTTVFAAFLFVLRGLPAPATALAVALGNAGATAWPVGEVSFAQPEPLIAAASAVAAVAMAAAIRGQRLYWSELDHSRREAIAGRDAAIERSVAEERVRIARDLHDLIGHEIAVVNMHLGAAEVQLPADATAPRNHLVAARGGVRSLLAETQEILRVLHTGHDDEATAGIPDHRRIPDLVARFAAAGTTVHDDLDQLPDVLPPQVSAAAYRIVQEALTNAQRHGTGPVSLTLTTAPGAIHIVVSNPIDPAAAAQTSPGLGHGLVGMRERATAAGGRLDVDRTVTDLTVRAVLPTIPGRAR